MTPRLGALALLLLDAIRRVIAARDLERQKREARLGCEAGAMGSSRGEGAG